MILDNNLRLADGAAFTSAGSGAVYAPNSIDLAVNRDVGQGTPVYVVFTVTAAFAGSTSGGSLRIFSASGVNGSGVVNADINVIASMDVDDSALTVGKQYVMPIPPHTFNPTNGALNNSQRYLSAGIFSGAAITTLSMTIDIALTYQDGKKFYASGFKFS
jgi:hypothetical protein